MSDHRDPTVRAAVEVEASYANHPLNGTEVANERWRSRARCRGFATSLFFPSDEQGTEAESAKAVCADCSVTHQCLRAALAGPEEYGVWGGTTPRERRRLRREHQRPA